MAGCWTNEQPNREGNGEKAAFQSVLATIAVQNGSAAKTVHSRGQPPSRLIPSSSNLIFPIIWSCFSSWQLFHFFGAMKTVTTRYQSNILGVTNIKNFLVCVFIFVWRNREIKQFLCTVLRR